MGLDVAFNRTRALAAGLVLKQDTNGTAEDIRRVEAQLASGEGQHDDDYVAWLKQEITLVEVPYANHLVQDDGIGDTIAVRANRWGNTYVPLTKWLTEKGIAWTEY